MSHRTVLDRQHCVASHASEAVLASEVNLPGDHRCTSIRSGRGITLLGTNRIPCGAFVLYLLMMTVLAGCDRLDMYDQPRYEALEASTFFGDGLSARPMIEGTVPRGSLRDDPPFFTGRDGEQFVSQIPDEAYRAVYDRNPQRFSEPFDGVDPASLRLALLERGRERFDIYCSVCHGRTGDGDGMIVRRGFRRPPSYHADRLREAAAGHFYDIISNGFGAMVSYSSRIDVGDRWAIVAYIRALQLTQNARLNDVPKDQRDALTHPPVTGESPARSQENAR